MGSSRLRPDGGMRPDESDPQKVLRHALGRAGIVLGYDHVCRRCKARHEPTHTWRHPDAIERRCERCGMRLWPKAVPRPMRFHDLRHTTATLLLRAGVDSHGVQRILRHRDVRTTPGIYGHLDVEDLRGALNALQSPPLPDPLPRLAPGARENGTAAPTAVFAARSTRLLPDSGAPKDQGPDPRVSPTSSGPSKWALKVSNLRPPPCEGGALPLS